MIRSGSDEKVYPVVKTATILELVSQQGVALAEALVGVHLSSRAISSPTTRVSLNQVIACYRNALKLSRDPRFAYEAGLRFHVSSYGMFRFAMLCSINFPPTMHLAVNYHGLSKPLADMS